MLGKTDNSEELVSGSVQDLAQLYRDDTQDSVFMLKKQAEKIKEEYPDLPFTRGDVVRDIIFFFVVLVGAFGWLLLMLLILSFVTLSVLKFNIDSMIVASAVFAVVVAIVYAVRKTDKYIKLLKK